MRLLFRGSGWPEIVDAIRERLGPRDTIERHDPTRPITEQLGGVDVILPSNGGVDAALLAAAPDLRLVQQPAVGTDGIDLAAARAHGVPVCNVPSANASSVAEAALLLMLALVRRWPVAQRAFADRTVGSPVGRELRGRTLGIVGLGRSGSALAEAARALGMRVVGVRSTNSRNELDELFALADVVSVHCPLTDATRGLVGRDAFRRMKRGALLINCGRGAVVDRAALDEALADGALGGVGLDVHWQEPWDPADPLYGRDDVVVLPHVAGTTEESFARIADVVADNTLRVERGDPPVHRVA